MKLLHPEDIKARLRKKFKTLLNFELVHGLPRESARDVLRGRGVQRTATAMASELGVSVEVISQSCKSVRRQHTSQKRDAHRLNEVA